MKQFEVRRELYEFPVNACVTVMERDILVVLTGGCLPHVGAVSVFDGNKELEALQLPRHKDGLVAKRWAKYIAEYLPFQVTVVCGIHYDDATGVMIEEIVRQTDEMLEETMQGISKHMK